MTETETKAKAATNGHGVLRVGRKGRMKFAFGDHAVLDPMRPALEIEADVLALYNDYCEMDAPFWGPDGKFIEGPGKMTEHMVAKLNLVRGWIIEGGKAMKEDGEAMALANDLSPAEALELIRMVTEEYTKLKPFFSPRASESELSSPESFGLRFST